MPPGTYQTFSGRAMPPDFSGGAMSPDPATNFACCSVSYSGGSMPPGTSSMSPVDCSHLTLFSMLGALEEQQEQQRRDMEQQRRDIYVMKKQILEELKADIKN